MKIIKDKRTVEFSNAGYVAEVTIFYENEHFKSINIRKGTQMFSFFDKESFTDIFNLLKEAVEYIKEN